MKPIKVGLTDCSNTVHAERERLIQPARPKCKEVYTGREMGWFLEINDSSRGRGVMTGME